MDGNNKKNNKLRVVWNDSRKIHDNWSSVDLPEDIKRQHEKIADQYRRIAELENKILNRSSTFRMTTKLSRSNIKPIFNT